MDCRICGGTIHAVNTWTRRYCLPCSGLANEWRQAQQTGLGAPVEPRALPHQRPIASAAGTIGQGGVFPSAPRPR